MAWAGVEARRWRWDYLALFSVRPIEAYRKSSKSKKDVDNNKSVKPTVAGNAVGRAIQREQSGSPNLTLAQGLENIRRSGAIWTAFCAGNAGRFCDAAQVV
jgi:hypothetical protein